MWWPVQFWGFSWQGNLELLKGAKKVIEKAAILNEIAQAHSIPLGAAAIQFPLANNIISSVIPGPRTKSELLQILDWYQTKIPNGSGLL